MFGMSLLERQLQAISEAGLAPTAVDVELPPEVTPSLPESLQNQVPLSFHHSAGPVGKQLAHALQETGQEARQEPLLVIQAHAIIDTRLLAYLGQQRGAVAAFGGEHEAATAVLRLEPDSPISCQQHATLPEIAQANVNAGQLKALALEDVPSYIVKLRRNLPIYLFGVTDTKSRDQAEDFLFWSNYKGSTDFFTKYVYPPLVWRLVRPLARWRVHPNVVTLISILLTVAAVPLFGAGQWLLGFLGAFGMSVLDSVDGKLARLTFRSSKLGDWLDHGLDIVHPPFWYAAWAWALGNGDLSSPVFQSALWLTVMYVLDRIIAGLFSWRHGRSIHGYTPLDERMRTFISRRNINLPVFFIGLLLGYPIPVFYALVGWQAVGLVFHTERLIQYWHTPPALSRAGEAS